MATTAERRESSRNYYHQAKAKSVNITKTEEKTEYTVKLVNLQKLVFKETVYTCKVTRAYFPSGHISNPIKTDVIGVIRENVNETILKKVSIDELGKLRRSGIPGFVLKVNDELFYAQIDRTMISSSSQVFGDQQIHQCAHCSRMSPAPDSCGGCEKVRSFSRGIERFKWITLGFETFNCEDVNNVFFVAECGHHVIERPDNSFQKKYAQWYVSRENDVAGEYSDTYKFYLDF